MSAERQYVSRAGRKLEAALREFQVDPRGWVCADFGSHTGGFVDCLLAHGALRVYAVEPGYGVLDYGLRKDPRVVVHERTSALDFFCPEPCDLVTIDVGWTRQRVILPAAARCLKPGSPVITLIKPQYEARPEWLRGGVLVPDHLEGVQAQCRADVRGLGWSIEREARSPIQGHGGNVEFLWLLRRAGSPLD